MYDADERLQKFIGVAETEQVDFIIQMGDFCRPYDYNREFLSIRESFSGNKYHVIRNLEMDSGFNRKQVFDSWKIPEAHYSFDTNDFHIIILNGNDKNPSKEKAPGYARFIGKKQLN